MFAATLVATLASAHGALYSSSQDIQKYMWNQFKTEYGHDFSASEDATRFGHFVENLRNIDARNIAESGSALHGITKFSHLSQEEFQSKMLNSKPSPNGYKNVHPKLNAPSAVAGLVDWTGTYTTPVKDQGYCGSCWAFSATEQIESDSMRTLGTSYILSPEQITQCDGTSFGCGGGWTEHAYNYVIRAGGIETDSSYPYTSYQGVTGNCKSDDAKFVVGIKGFTTINGESDMASYVQSTGPLSVCVDANNWNSYRGGIMTVCGQSVDHCVQAVGVDASANGYWKVRNSWGTSWGESGYIRLAYGKNTCAIASDPTYVSAVLA